MVILFKTKRMEKRSEWEEECPKCWSSMKMFDDQSIGSHWGFCDECWYEDPRDYYKNTEDVDVLITKEEALLRDYIRLCPECGDIMYPNEYKDGRCIICNA